MARKVGLGKGLDALIPGGTPSTIETETTLLPISKIAMNPRQPRHPCNEDDLRELAASIREHGIIQPLIITHEPETDTYTLIAGERRLLAAQLAGLNSVPVLVRDATEQQRLELALIENLHRSDLNPLEMAEAYHQLQDGFGLSQEEIAIQVGKSRVAVSNTLRLLNLPKAVRTSLEQGQISEGHARALLGLKNHNTQLAVLQIILKRGSTVRQVEELVRQLSGKKSVSPPKKRRNAEILALEENLRQHFGTKVNIRQGKRGGSITIHYYSDEELNSLIAKLL